ncbi:ABC transporter ATP-binding protein [Lagierella massiliensis]|uniref:ABC transporter ATP-binding protein n=1 Tax=Lagierella massiliensis TaxID=1689303 RepID=UPI0006D83900|nr:ABC transporter ATP-binding protein [Lagierella massiliensis]
MIKIVNVTKKFGENKVLDDVNLIFEPGKIYGIQGKNGSGKTMLMRAISGLLSLNEGEVEVFGEVIGVDRDFPKSAGILIEHPGLLPEISGFENLKTVMSINKIVSDEEIKKAMSDFDLDPNSNLKVKKYSLGMKQKVGILMAILERPQVVILDEPTNGLDEASVKKFKDMILNLKDDSRVIIVASHDREGLEEISDEIIKMELGRVIS